jgi:hypothetical protein
LHDLLSHPSPIEKPASANEPGGVDASTASAIADMLSWVENVGVTTCVLARIDGATASHSEALLSMPGINTNVCCVMRVPIHAFLPARLQ